MGIEDIKNTDDIPQAASKKVTKGKRGGARKGAGRKAPNGKTKVMRIPVQYSHAVEALIAHLKSQSESIELAPTEVYLRDLKDRQLDLTISTRLRRMKS